jgi:hypothetical protein
MRISEVFRLAGINDGGLDIPETAFFCKCPSCGLVVELAFADKEEMGNVTTYLCPCGSGLVAAGPREEIEKSPLAKLRNTYRLKDWAVTGGFYTNIPGPNNPGPHPLN